MAATTEPTSPPEPRASVIQSIAEGWRRALRAPVLTASVVLAMLLVAEPFVAIVLQHMATGATVSYSVILHEPARELIREIGYTISMLNGELAASAITGGFDRKILLGISLPASTLFLAYGLITIFLSGGIVDRLARDRPVRSAAFFAACGAYVFPLIRLAIFPALACFALYRWVLPPGGIIGEGAGLEFVRLLLLVGIAIVVDFARVRLIVEDRRSAIGAYAASFRFVRRHLGGIVVLYLFYLSMMALAIWLPSWTAVLAGVWIRLAWLGSETAYFQQSLAHARYTAAPPRKWPESAAVEAIRNLRVDR